MRAAAFACLLLAATAAQAAGDLLALRVASPVMVTSAGRDTPLTPGRALLAGEVLSAGPRGRAALQLDGGGLITLGSLGSVQVYAASAGAASSPALGKFKLLAGPLKADSRGYSGGLPQDLRLNVGGLKVRVYGASVWGAVTREGDTLCLISGAVEVQAGGTPDLRLDAAGDCLRRSPDGRVSRLNVNSEPVIAAAIAATEFGDTVELPPGPAPMDLPADSPSTAAVQTPKPTRSPPIIARAASDLPAVAPMPVPGAKAGAWTLVVLSLAERKPVEARAQSLQDQGFAANVRETQVKGRTWHRVTVGEFSSQDEARRYAQQTLAKAGIQAWVARL